MIRTDRKISLRHIFCCILVASFANSLSAATIIVGNGGSISSAIASASSGDTIEIQSDQFFNETLTWQNKFLTVRAAAGFSPSVFRIQNVNGTSPGAGGSFAGLSINELILRATGTRYSDVTFRENIVSTKVSLGGTGNYDLTALFENNQFTNGMLASNTGEAKFNITVRGNTSYGDLNFVGNNGPHPVLVESNYIAGELTFATSSDDTIDATVLRNEIHGNVIFALGDFSTSKLTAKNNLIVPPSGGTQESGFDVRALGGSISSTTTLTLINNSIIGFNKGLTTSNVNGVFTTQIENMLLYNNDDIVGFASNQIGNSLISDGTFAGVNGNIGGTPLLTSGYQLILESPGIDAGSNAAAAGLITDLRGHPRIIDGNQDGILRVDVGAIESPVPEPSGAALAVAAAVLMLTPTVPCLRPIVPIRL